MNEFVEINHLFLGYLKDRICGYLSLQEIELTSSL